MNLNWSESCCCCWFGGRDSFEQANCPLVRRFLDGLPLEFSTVAAAAAVVAAADDYSVDAAADNYYSVVAVGTRRSHCEARPLALLPLRCYRHSAPVNELCCY